MKFYRKDAILLILFLLSSFLLFAQNNMEVALFNGENFKGWNTYIGPLLDDAGKKLSTIPLGLNIDPNHVFTIVNQDGKMVIRISGENWGCLYTQKEYENFHLRLMFKWGKLIWGQKKGKKKGN